MNFVSRPTRLGLPLALSVMVLLSPQAVSAQAEESRVVTNPPLLELTLSLKGCGRLRSARDDGSGC